MGRALCPCLSAPVVMATDGGLAGERGEGFVCGGSGFGDQLGSFRNGVGALGSRLSLPLRWAPEQPQVHGQGLDASSSLSPLSECQP